MNLGPGSDTDTSGSPPNLPVSTITFSYEIRSDVDCREGLNGVLLKFLRCSSNPAKQLETEVLRRCLQNCEKTNVCC